MADDHCRASLWIHTMVMKGDAGTTAGGVVGRGSSGSSSTTTTTTSSQHAPGHPPTPFNHNYLASFSQSLRDGERLHAFPHAPSVDLAAPSTTDWPVVSQRGPPLGDWYFISVGNWLIGQRGGGGGGGGWQRLVEARAVVSIECSPAWPDARGARYCQRDSQLGLCSCKWLSQEEAPKCRGNSLTIKRPGEGQGRTQAKIDQWLHWVPLRKKIHREDAQLISLILSETPGKWLYVSVVTIN